MRHIRYKISFYFILLLIIGCYFPTVAQWNSNPSENTKICNTIGKQFRVNIAGLSDGGCYISWLDENISSTQLYLQRLDPTGEKKWDENGLLVADIELSPSYLISYNITTNDQDNAILVFPNLIGEDNFNLEMKIVDTYGNEVIRVDSIGFFTGEEVVDGVFITETSDSDLVTCWNQDSSIFLQKINILGKKKFGELPLSYHHELDQKYRNSELIESDSGRVILVYSTIEGLLPFAKLYIYSQKFDKEGNPLWGKNGLIIQNLNDIAFHQEINVISDQDCGVIISWSEDRNFDYMEDIFMQRISRNGHLLYNENGIQVCEESEKDHFYPCTVFFPSIDGVFVFWIKMDNNQIFKGIYGQKITSSGILKWGTSGKEFVSLCDQSVSDLQAINFNNSIYIIYRKVFMDSYNIPITDEINSFLINEDGDFIWENKFRKISERSSLKKGPVITIDNLGSLVISWEDYQNDNLENTNIYAQKLNINGTLGNILNEIKTNNKFPKEFHIFQNYPNPFNPITNIEFDIAESQNVELLIYDILGTEKEVLFDGYMKAGRHKIVFNGLNYASGVYLYKIVTNNYTQTKKLLLLK